MKLDLDRQGPGRSELAVAGELALGLTDGRARRAVLAGTLTVDNVAARFIVTGDLGARGTAQCGRCLRDFELHWDVPVEIIVLRDAEADEGEGDSLVVRQRTGEVDLREPMRESAVLAHPLAPVCDDGCRGLCPVCGCDRNEKTCACSEHDTDPRWDGLP